MQCVTYPITIYYDASCPLCRREIDLLKQFDTASQIALVDCSPENYQGEGEHTRAAMMKLIHAKDANGRWMIGAPVFSAAYVATGFSAIARLWGARWLQPFWRVVYPWIANNRTLLSKLGAMSAMTNVLHWFHARSAQSALANAAQCHDGVCDPAAKKSE
jgi:predicted DCC family thiol-disulfide oxidoreductase YuxK